MAGRDDRHDDEVRRIAYGLWESEGRPGGRAETHWDAAREIWAAQEAGAPPPPPAGERAVEPLLAVENQGPPKGLTDQAETLPAPSRRRRGRS